MTTCVSGGTCMSRSNLRLGASEGESDALFGKGSGSNTDLVRGRRDARIYGCEIALEAVTFEAFDSDRPHLANDVGRGHHVRRLQIGGASDDLAGIARSPLEQHIHGGANRSLVERR